MIDLGGVPGTPRIGFRYWKDPGPFVEYIATGSWGKFLGFWTVMCKSSSNTQTVVKANMQNSQRSLQLRRGREHRNGRCRDKEPASLYPTSMQESLRPSLHLLRPRGPDRGHARAKRRRETRR